MLDTDTGELVEKVLEHDGEKVREFYAALTGPILVGIEATGSMHCFQKLMEELKIEYRAGRPAKIREAETRKQKHDRRDARLLLKLLAENSRY
jgi:transposase